MFVSGTPCRVQPHPIVDHVALERVVDHVHHRDRYVLHVASVRAVEYPLESARRESLLIIIDHKIP